MLKLSPSILSADFSKLAQEIKEVEDAGAHYLHIDVMDGHFVPNISIGLPVIKSIRQITDMTLDVHLMITNPYEYIESFANCGADIINFHIESNSDIISTIQKIRSFNKRAALTISPKTEIKSVLEYLDKIDMVLIMSVEPGFGNQAFLPNSLKKINKIADFIQNNSLLTEIEVDGGITLSNVSSVIDAGANIIVAGSSIFKADNKSNAIRDFYNIFKTYGDKS